MSIKWDTMKTAEQQEAERLEALAQQVRGERDSKLYKTDFYMLQDAPPAPAGVAEYRQALRDITEQPGFPESVQWPELST
ncbi:phage tail assembly chaperone [Rheinheimera sp.]|uniref:phage tail assembly chaperone n=1 Tax=Rheinheimera sp. TaxID=1869214 RepID=UPI002732C7EC|nr:phage tail assembly chaperone [Rheinheimera sp.]MDP2715549.1 phage tail assembly chaperone [Rheinheimera sp.]